MLCRMLLGRTALAGLLLVDSNLKYMLTERSRKKHRQRFDQLGASPGGALREEGPS